MKNRLYIHDLALYLGTTEAAIRSQLARDSSKLPPYCRRGTRIYWRPETVEKWEAESEARSVALNPKKIGRPRKVPIVTF